MPARTTACAMSARAPTTTRHRFRDQRFHAIRVTRCTAAPVRAEARPDVRLDTITGAVDGNVPIDCIELQAVAGVLPVESGRVVVDGTDVTALDTRGRRRTGMAVI